MMIVWRSQNMSAELEALPELVRSRAVKMRELIKIIENAPLKDVVAATSELKAEIETLLSAALKAAGRRI
jgi:hypothetical protein